MRIPVPFSIQTNKARSDAVGSSRLINMFAERAPENAKSLVPIYRTPGTTLFCKLPTRPILALPIHNKEQYAVTPTKLYRIKKNGSFVEVGDVDLSGRVSFATNGISLVLVDGNKGFTVTDDEIAELTGDGWYPATTVTYQDGYFIFNRADTGQFFLSELLSTEFDPLKFATAEGAPDDTTAVISKSRELWVFGESSIEVWYNSGDPDFPFERMQGAFVERGCISPSTINKLDNTLFFVGTDKMVYRVNGYEPVRISNHGIEIELSKYQLEDAFAWSYVDEGHSFYLLTIPAANKTYCFDIATNLWHERSHSKHGRYHANCYSDFAGVNLVGDFQNGNIYELSSSAYKDNSDPLIIECYSLTINAANQILFQSEFELLIESGVGLVNGQGSNPQAMLQYSDDDGNTWSNEKWDSMGAIGQYRKRARWLRLGSFRNRIFRLRISDPVPICIISAYAEVTRGTD